MLDSAQLKWSQVAEAKACLLTMNDKAAALSDRIAAAFRIDGAEEPPILEVAEPPLRVVGGDIRVMRSAVWKFLWTEGMYRVRPGCWKPRPRMSDAPRTHFASSRNRR